MPVRTRTVIYMCARMYVCVRAHVCVRVRMHVCVCVYVCAGLSVHHAIDGYLGSSVLGPPVLQQSRQRFLT